MPPRLLWLALLPLLALEPTLSRAEGSPPPFFDPEMSAQLRAAGDLARKATEDLLRSFEMLRSAIPRYGAPYVDEHGNIVIPRRPRLPAPSPDAPDRA